MTPFDIVNPENLDWMKFAMESGHEIIEIDSARIAAGSSFNPLRVAGEEIDLTISDMVDNVGNIVPYSEIKKKITYDQWERAAKTLRAIKERLDGNTLSKNDTEGTRELFEFPLHSMSGVVMKLTENNAIMNPFFTRNEESILSLIMLYLEDIFEPFCNPEEAIKLIRENKTILACTLDTFKEAFNQLPNNAKSQAIFNKTPFSRFTPGWEDNERRTFDATMAGIRRRFL